MKCVSQAQSRFHNACSTFRALIRDLHNWHASCFWYTLAVIIHSSDETSSTILLIFEYKPYIFVACINSLVPSQWEHNIYPRIFDDGSSIHFIWCLHVLVLPEKVFCSWHSNAVKDRFLPHYADDTLIYCTAATYNTAFDYIFKSLL